MSRQQIITQAIVLARTDFQEADRILTLLTPDQGKLKVIAKGVRRPRSKLAGGIELLSISDVTVLPGRGDLGTLISARMRTHYGQIVRDIDRTMLAYELLKRINRMTEDIVDEDYFTILQRALEALDDEGQPAFLAELWFILQLLKVTGHTPNLQTDAAGAKLDPAQDYLFDFEDMAFRAQEGAPYGANHIKLLRLAFATDQPLLLKNVADTQELGPETLKLVTHLMHQSLRV